MRSRELLRIALLSGSLAFVTYSIGTKFPDLGMLKIVSFLPVPFFFAAMSGFSKHFAGSKLEDRLVEELSSLSDEYWCVTNMPVPGGGGDIDLVLFGPHGALVIESKCYTSATGCEGDRWFIIRDGARRQPIKSVSGQLNRNATALDRHLRNIATETMVNGVIVFNKTANLRLSNPKAAIIRAGELLSHIASLPQTARQVDPELFRLESARNAQSRAAH